MIRRPRSVSVAQKSAAAASAPDAKQEDSSGHKRKLSATAAEQEDQKKSKTAPEDEEDEEGKAEESVDKVEEEEDEEDEEEESDIDDDELDANEGNNDAKLQGPGPHVFYLWADGISSLLETEEDMTYITLKSSVLNAYRKVAHLPEDKREGAVGEYIHSVDTWPIDTTEEARETPAAKALLEVWEGRRRKKAEGGAGGETDADKDLQWWYEVTVQKDSPGDDTPHLAVTVEYHSSEVWYLTSIKAADKEGNQAMCTVVNYTAAWYQ